MVLHSVVINMVKGIDNLFIFDGLGIKALITTSQEILYDLLLAIEPSAGEETL